ncbi:MAG: two-component regulator propeller domain-containing protein, partial [Saprospiraceae bacterium]
GRLWIGTTNNGADVFDPSTGRFYHLNKLVDQDIYCFAETPDGTVWIGSNKGGNRLRLPDVLPAGQPDLQSVVQVETIYWDDPHNGGTVVPDHTADLVAGSDGRLWVSTNLQVGCYDPSSGRFQTVISDFRGLSKDGELFVPQLFARPDGSIWVAHPDQLLHIRSGGIDAFPLPERSVFPQTELAFDATGKLFVCTRKQIFTLSAADIQAPGQAHFDLFYRFPADGIIGSTRLLIDRGGLLWIGTNGYGLRKYNPGDRHFRHFLPGVSLRRVATDAQGRTWVWRSGSKFYRLDEAADRLVEPLLENEPNLLQHDLLADRNGALWLLGEDKVGLRQGAGTLVKLNPQTLRPEARFLFPDRISILSQFQEDHTGRLRIIGTASTLITFDPSNGTFKTADFSSTTGYRETSFCLHEDVAGQYWIGTPHGLVRGIAGNQGIQFSLYKNNPADRQSLNCDVVLATLDDLRQPDRYLWVGTKGGGLNLLDKTTGKCRHFTTADGLPNNVVYAILPDSSGALWLSTNCGLAKFDPSSTRFQNYFVADGLQDNEFNTASFAHGAEGRLFFGGVNGLTAFYPQALAAATVAPPVFLTALKIQNHPVLPGDGILEKSIGETTAITLSHFQNQLTFEFAAMDFSAPQQNQYRYRLLGADRDWVEPTTANSATYANLAPGHYVFEVATGGSHGIWNGTPTRLSIDILPPWWRTNGAYLLYFLAVVAGAWGFYRFQINKLHLKNELAFEQREAERLAELDRLKTNFFNSVTHEFRTPLTLLLEPARQLVTDVQDHSIRYRLELIEKNARRLLRFVNQLLDLSKLEAGQMPLDLRPDSP